MKRQIKVVGRTRERACAVIVAENLRRSCHLIPKLRNTKKEINPDGIYTVHNILEKWPGSFFLNAFADKATHRSMYY